MMCIITVSSKQFRLVSVFIDFSVCQGQYGMILQIAPSLGSLLLHEEQMRFSGLFSQVDPSERGMSLEKKAVLIKN